MPFAIQRPRKAKPVLMNFKATPDQRVQLKKLAKQYTQGNLTLWMLYASLNHKPRKKDLTMTRK